MLSRTLHKLGKSLYLRQLSALLLPGSASSACRNVCSSSARWQPDAGSGDRQAEGSDESAHEAKFEDPQVAILDAALGHVRELGWTRAAISAGADDLGFPPLSHGMFDKGDYALVHHVMRRATESMAAEMETLPLERMSGDERIVAGVRARLSYLGRFVQDGTWPAAMALGALPQNSLDTATELGILVDELWYLAGDQSTDASWYSRRGLLLAVHASTELFMLTDQSEGFEETWDFLERRVEDVSGLGAKAGSVGDVAAAVGTGVSSLAGGAFALARPFVEAQKGNNGKAMDSALSLLRQFGSAAAEAAQAPMEPRKDADSTPDPTEAAQRV